MSSKDRGSGSSVAVAHQHYPGGLIALGNGEKSHGVGLRQVQNLRGQKAAFQDLGGSGGGLLKNLFTGGLIEAGEMLQDDFAIRTPTQEGYQVRLEVVGQHLFQFYPDFPVRN